MLDLRVTHKIGYPLFQGQVFRLWFKRTLEVFTEKNYIMDNRNNRNIGHGFRNAVTYVK